MSQIQFPKHRICCHLLSEFIKYVLSRFVAHFVFLAPSNSQRQTEKSHKSRCPLLILVMKVHYEWWRRILKYFWMSVVMYTMLVLTVVYTFQFPESIHTWGNMTGLDKKGWAPLSNCRSERQDTDSLPTFPREAQLMA